MGYPKGRPRGPQSADHKAKIAAGNSIGQRRRWADPEARARAVAGIKASYQFGPLRGRRVHWTEEMDAVLRQMRATLKFSAFRAEAAKRIGVGDRVLMRRLHDLGLVDPVQSARTAGARLRHGFQWGVRPVRKD